MASLNTSNEGHDYGESQVAVLMVPFAAQGHLNQLVQFSCLISSYGLPVYYIGSAIHNRQAKDRVNGIDSQQLAKIHFQDMILPPFESPSPDPNSPNKFPYQLLPAWIASLSLRQPFATYLQEMSSKYRRVVVVHDPLMAAVVQDVSSIENAESYVFNCIAACHQVNYVLARLGKELPADFPKFPSFEGLFSEDLLAFVAMHIEHLGIRAGDIHNTSRSIEAPYLDLLEREEVTMNKKGWAIGPIVSSIISLSPEKKTGSRHECIQWLEKQERNSVIYISFGSTTSLSTEQINELALGLEKSEVKFLWVLRDADKADVFDGQVRRVELPESYEERIKGAGLVVRDWAPQPEILSHPSTGGFMSHCGWNSCIESITMGVPIAAWPMHSDQPINSILITEVLKVGLTVRDWSQRLEIVKASTIEKVVRRLIATEEGNELRTRAKDLAATVQQATRPGGSSRLELDTFIAHITR